MKVISIIGQKGGTGKTTISTNLAVCAASAGKSTVLIDLDSQPTASRWGDRRTRNGVEVVSAQVARLPQLLEGCRQNGVQCVVLDTPPRTDTASLSAAKAAALVLVPVKPAISDVETLTAIRDLLSLAGARTARVVINAAPVRGSRHLECERFVESLGLECAPVVLHQRQAFADAPNEGLGVVEYDPSGTAAFEVKKLYEYTCKIVDA